MTRSKKGKRETSREANNNREVAVVATDGKIDELQELKENLSFCGCGFLGIYHVGVASCFHKYAPQISLHKISGSSVGALVAVAHMCGNLKLIKFTTGLIKVATEARARTLGPIHPSFDINGLLREGFQEGLPNDVHLRVNGKLHISLTRVPDFKNVVVTEFESKEDLIEALICSCFIPFWSGLDIPKFKGVTYMDGGCSNNLLVLDDKTITVSPFAGESDICPQDDVYNLLSISLCNTSISITPHNLNRVSYALYPPPPEVLRKLCEQGYADGIRFLRTMKLISCEQHGATTMPTTVEEDIESITEELDGFPFYTSYLERRYSATSSTYSIQIRRSSLTLHEDLEDKDDCYISSSEDENCVECLVRRANASSDSLPELVRDQIREACDTVNQSLYNWFYSHKPIWYLSYLVVPYYLPIDLALICAKFMRYWQDFPKIIFMIRLMLSA